MDEQEYKDIYQAVNAQRCVFEKAMLTRRFGCEKVIRFNIAEREAVGCSQLAAQQTCQAMLETLRKNAAFALKMTHASGMPLPHAKEIKVQCGGLIGLQKLLDDQAGNTGVDNIHATIARARQTFGEMDQFPFTEIMKFVTHFEGRKRRRKK